MKIAVMQPYLFPYIGYWQLISAVDKFIVFDDVNYIQKGWINRNNILINHQPSLFTVPLLEASQNKKINEIKVSPDFKWKLKLLKTVEMAYKKAPFFNKIFNLIEQVILNENHLFIRDFILDSFKLINYYLDIKTNIIPTSAIYENHHLKGEERIIDICLKENANTYINLMGGVELYNKTNFKAKDLHLHFIKSNHIMYKQFSNSFIPHLSIIDVLMFNPREDLKNILQQYELI